MCRVQHIATDLQHTERDYLLPRGTVSLQQLVRFLDLVAAVLLERYKVYPTAEYQLYMHYATFANPTLRPRASLG